MSFCFLERYPNTFLGNDDWLQRRNGTDCCQHNTEYFSIRPGSLMMKERVWLLLLMMTYNKYSECCVIVWVLLVVLTWRFCILLFYAYNLSKWTLEGGVRIIGITIANRDGITRDGPYLPVYGVVLPSRNREEVLFPLLLFTAFALSKIHYSTCRSTEALGRDDLVRSVSVM